MDNAAALTRASRLAWLFGLAVLVAAPFLGLYPVFLMKALCYAIFACAFNLLLGYTGLLSFGHAAYLGAVVGLIAIRRQGIYFAMVTQAMAQMVYFVCLRAPFTGGEDGLQGVPRGRLLGILPLGNDITMYFTVLAVFVAVFQAVIRIVHSPYGQVLKAIRENEPRAISLGYDVDRYKLLAFVLSTALAGSLKTLVLGFATLGRALESLGRGGADDPAGWHGHLRRPGAGRHHHHRSAGHAGRPRGLVGDGDHRRDPRGLRGCLPQGLCWRTAGLVQPPPCGGHAGQLNARRAI